VSRVGSDRWHPEGVALQKQGKVAMAGIRKLPLVLLGVMTVLAFVGPFVIWMVMRGGGHGEWPPDRPVEWFTFVAVAGLVAVLMLACFGLAAGNRRDRLRRLEDLEVNLDRDRASSDEMDIQL
jgi:hypothetical protein